MYPDAIIQAVRMLGAPYLWNAKWPVGTYPVSRDSPIDCSGFSRWILSLADITIPDGSFNQIKVCTKLPASQQSAPPCLTLGFYQPQDTVDHVVVSCGGGVVIEAHGSKVLTPGVPSDCVVLRTVDSWLKVPGFLGFYAPPGLSTQD